MQLITLAIASLAAVASAAPQRASKSGGGGPGGGGSTRNDLSSGCKPVIFINARATGEAGNFGGSTGPGICSALGKKFSGKVACQGVGGAYKAAVADNVGQRGTSAGAQQEAISVFTNAAQKCPESYIVASGYSQGSAVMAASVSKLPQQVKQRIAGVVLFGYTKNKQNNGKIPSYPGDRVLTFCDKSDGVCGGGLSVTAGHFVYVRNGDIGKAADFLAGNLAKAGFQG